MDETKRYNSWTNYETWAVNLWLTNEQSSDSYMREKAQETWDNQANRPDPQIFTQEEAATHSLADQLKDEYEEAKDQLLADAKATASVLADLLGAALSEVNWQEIAGHFIDDVKKD